jgi:segregation and condensation protein B
MTEPGGDRAPISWEALAAELATELTGEPEEAAAGQPGEAWDAVAARLAAGLRAPAGAAPVDAGDDRAQLGDPVAEERAATVAEASPASPPRTPEPLLDDAPAQAGTPARPRLGRAPQSDPVQLVVVDQPEPAVEESVPVLPAPPASEGGAGPAATGEVVDDPEALRGGLEALLFVVDAPVDEVTLAAALRCPVGRVREELAGLAADYDQRRAGVTLRRVGEGWRVYTREEHADVVERYLLEGQRSRLTQAALETLAVIAYRQPVTRARVSAIRGVGVDAVVRTLVNRGLVRECGSDPDTGGGLYATTPLFLERLGLTGLEELPELAPLLPETRTMLDEHPDV